MTISGTRLILIGRELQLQSVYYASVYYISAKCYYSYYIQQLDGLFVDANISSGVCAVCDTTGLKCSGEKKSLLYNFHTNVLLAKVPSGCLLSNGPNNAISSSIISFIKLSSALISLSASCASVLLVCQKSTIKCFNSLSRYCSVIN